MGSWVKNLWRIDRADPLAAGDTYRTTFEPHSGQRPEVFSLRPQSQIEHVV